MIVERNSLAARPLPPALAERLTVALAPEAARFSLRLRPAGIGAAGAAFGAPLPERIGGLSAAGERLAVRLGPDEWALLAPAGEAFAITERFAAAAAALGPHSLVDVSHREVGIEVSGCNAGLALASVCALDLDAMPAPSATRTILDKAQVLLIRQAPDRYRIEVWQSFAPHVLGLLAAVSRELALDI